MSIRIAVNAVGPTSWPNHLRVAYKLRDLGGCAGFEAETRYPTKTCRFHAYSLTSQFTLCLHNRKRPENVSLRKPVLHVPGHAVTLELGLAYIGL